MNSKEHLVMSFFETEYWWHKGKKYLIEHLLNKFFSKDRHGKLKIFEIGCGTGEISKMLQKYGTVSGLDISETAADEYERKCGIRPLIGDINELNLESLKNSFDLILALDVLEHVQDDIKAMERVKFLLKKDGVFFINVPAYKFIWSEHDEALQHKRRYSTYELTEKLKRAGFNIELNSHFVCMSFPLIAFYRVWGNFFGKSAFPKTTYIKLPKKLNTIMYKMLQVETKLLTKFRLPLGSTITVVAKQSSV